jgi:hypothetical protein
MPQMRYRHDRNIGRGLGTGSRNADWGRVKGSEAISILKAFTDAGESYDTPDVLVVASERS